MDDTLQVITDAIRNRRTLKQALMDPDREVARALLDEMFENANWAPTHGLTEPWRFTVFVGDARNELAGALQRIYRLITPAEQFREEKFAKLGATPLQANVVVALGMKRDPSGRIPAEEEVAAVACAVQNMHLTAAAAGVGAKWSSPPASCAPEFCSYLGLDANLGDRCLGLFYLGYPKDGVAFPGGRRKPAADKVEWR